MNDLIPQGVLDFVRLHIHSVEQLETLLLLFQRPGRAWSAEEVSAELRTNQSSATKRLSDLKQRGLVVADGEAGKFRGVTEDPQLLQTVEALAAAYRQYRFRIIDLIFSKPSGALYAFAEAFKLKKDDKDG